MSHLIYNTLTAIYANLNLPSVLFTVLLASFFICFVAPLLFCASPHASGTRPRPDLYSPKGAWPVVGHVFRVLAMRDRQPEQLVTLLMERQKDGIKDPARALCRTIPGTTLILLTRPEHLEWIQKTNFSGYEKGKDLPNNMGQILGEGIFTTDGHKWSIQRKASSRIFHNSAFRSVIASSISKSLSELVDVLTHFADKGDEIALSDLFFRLTLDSFCHMALGTEPGALKAALQGKSVPFAVAFDYSQLVMSRRFTNPFWAITERLDGSHARMKEAAKAIDDYAYHLIDEREKELAKKTAGGGSVEENEVGVDLLTLYMKIKDDNGRGLNRKELRDAVLALVFAGRDTTAQTLSWTLFHLLSHPHHIDRLVEEARHILNSHGELEYDRLKDMNYTTAVFMEGARLHPSVPINAWEAVADDQIPNGPRIEKGDKVTWSDWVMARDVEVWGPDAGQFKPERWLDDQGKYRKESQWKAHMFNGGYRVCLGQTLATFEGVSVLAHLFTHFDLSFAPDYLATTPMVKTEWCGSETPLYANSVTLPMAQPLRVKAVPKRVEKN
ncbi:hypothetical protein JCM1840_006607 [Sporobolomyces johnsonii]